jgi:hypothetical protein
MRFLADENFPLPGVRRLRVAGIDIASVSEDSCSLVGVMETVPVPVWENCVTGGCGGD